MAGVERLKPFADIKQLHSIVKNSNGAYTHDEAFELNVSFAYQLQLMEYEESSFQSRFTKHYKEYHNQER
jgi:hypothetical protein